jgi:hypothetical protein
MARPKKPKTKAKLKAKANAKAKKPDRKPTKKKPSKRAPKKRAPKKGAAAVVAAPPPRRAVERFLVVKVVLHDRGDRVESARCQPVGFEEGRALFRVDSVPFLHAKPTYDDVIVARGDDTYAGNWTWNGAAGRIHKDGGRYALLVEYHASAEADFQRLTQLLRRDHDIVVEIGYPPQGKKPGRLYLAAPRRMGTSEVLRALGSAGEGFRIDVVRPL